MTLALETQEIKRGPISTVGPNPVLKLSKLSKTKGLECEPPEDKLCLTKSKIKDQLAASLITITEGELFDQPSAARTLAGSLQFFSRFTKETTSASYIAINPKTQSIDIATNCLRENIQKLASSNVTSKTFEIKLYQNSVEAVSLWHTGIDVQEVLSLFPYKFMDKTP